MLRKHSRSRYLHRATPVGNLRMKISHHLPSLTHKAQSKHSTKIMSIPNLSIWKSGMRKEAREVDACDM